MSRKSILTLTAVAVLGTSFLSPVNAFAHGSFGHSAGHFSMGRFGHAPAMGGHVHVGGRFEHPALGRHFPGEMRTAFRHPQAPQADRSRWLVRFHAATGVGAIADLNNPTAPGAAAAAAARREAEKNQGQSGAPPEVVGGRTVFGQGGQQHGPGQSIPGVGHGTNGPGLNLPGAGTQQQGPRSIPGFDSVGGGPRLNLPGTLGDQRGPETANHVVNQLAQQDGDILNAVSEGGLNSLNIPTAAGSDVTATDQTDNKKPKTGGSNNNSGSGSGSSSTTTTPSNGGNNSNGGSNSTGSNSGGSSSNTTTSSKTVWVNPTDGSTNYTSIMTDSQGNAQMATVTVQRDGKATLTTMGRDSNGNITGPTTIPLSGYRHMPGDDDTGSVSPGTPLSPHSDIAKKDRGGGTDNNNETTAGKTGAMAPGSPYARKDQGDGGSNDAGDNNHVDKGGALANGSTLTRKDQGDGGGSDTRGGGGSSTIGGTAKVGNPGGGPKQISATTATKAD